MSERDQTDETLDEFIERERERMPAPSPERKAKLGQIIGPAAATVKTRRAAARTATRQRMTRT